MAPPFLKKRTTKEASSRKLSVRIRSDAKETKQQRERRRAAISTGSANIRDEDMLAHGVSEDIVASFAVKEKKADVPQWMLDLKTPVKRPKLPQPGFYQSPDELKPQACIDEWARVSHASMGSTGVLTDVLSPLDFDLATDQSRSFFREEASRAIIQRKKELVVDTFIPKGSILYDDWEGGVSRRRNKAPNETFKRRSYYFSLLQKRRLDSLHGAGSGEYARLLLELTGNADAALRSELERERERRLQALIIRVKLRMLTEHFEAFVEYMRRCFYVKEKFAKMLAAVWKSNSDSGASAMARPSWLGRAVRDEHHHAIEQASR